MRVVTPIRSLSAAMALIAGGCGPGTPPAAPGPVAALAPPAKTVKGRVVRPHVPVRVGPGSVSR